jgi:predicted transcriptional regulator
MPTITIEPELYQRIEKAASYHNINISHIFSQALQHYLLELDQLAEIEQILERAASSGSRRKFQETISAINWTTTQPDQFILAIDLALELGDTTLAAELCGKGQQRFLDNSQLQRLAQVLASPKVTISKQPPLEGLSATLRWVEENASEHRGHWVAIKDGNLIGSAKTRQGLNPALTNCEFLADILIAQVP